jgi:hypothetical protein
MRCGHVACTEKIRNANNLLGNPEGSRPHARPRSRWKDIIKINLKEIKRENSNWIPLALYKAQ